MPPISELFAAMPRLELVLLVGAYAQVWHLGDGCRSKLTETVANWRAIRQLPGSRIFFPLPHPSWRNSGWLKRNPWFETDLLPVLRQDVAGAVAEN